MCDLDALTCACRKYELNGIPCMHVVASIWVVSFEPGKFVDKFYHRETYIKCYEHCIQPLNGCQMWPKTSLNHVLPPYYCKMKGMPNAGARRIKKDEKKNKKMVDPYK